MKIRSLFLLMIIAVLLGMATACDDPGKDPNNGPEDGGGDHGGPTSFGDKLEFSNEQVYMLELKIDGNKAAYEFKPYTGADVIFDSVFGATPKIVGGKFSFSVGVPPSRYLEDNGLSYLEENYINFKVSDTTAKYVTIGFRKDSSGISLGRANVDEYDLTVSGSGENMTSTGSATMESVSFVYVDKSVTITGKGKTTTGTYGEGRTYTIKYNDINLSLAKGWNTLCSKTEISVSATSYSYTITQSVSNPGSVKWVLTVPEYTDPDLPGQYIVVAGEDLLEKLQWINSNAASNNTYILEVGKDELIGPQNLSYGGKSNITIQLKGTGGLKNIELYGSGSLFTIWNNVTLILDENIVLKGSVGAGGGNLIMNNGSKITGGRVSVGYGTFTMNGGEISGNTVSSYNDNGGGGVYVGGGTFTMTGGKISGNTSSYNNNGGGGVYVGGGTFTMSGGEISGNTVYSSSYSGSGGGVYVSGGTFTMNGGEISGNTVSGSYNNSGGGGGVYVSDGTFTMNGGEISGNTVTVNSSYSGSGGGVYVSASSSFEKTGGIITGYSSDTVNSNVVKENNTFDNGNVLDNRGHAVYVDHNNNNFIRRKETTAGQGDNLKYIRNEPNPPTISGAWDE